MPEEIPKKENIGDVLTREENVTIVSPSERWSIPPDFNFQALEWLGIDESELREWATTISEIINKPMIIDRFDRDHDSRRKWRSEMEHKYGEDAIDFLYQNKLRTNSFSVINSILANLELLLGKTTDQRKELVNSAIQKFRKSYLEIVAGYDEMNIEEKKNAVQKLDTPFKEFLMDLQR